MAQTLPLPLPLAEAGPLPSPLASPLEATRLYYQDRFARAGDTPQGVDWRDETAQDLRLSRLVGHLDLRGASLLDVGCGTGALLRLLARERAGCAAYAGIDLVPAMVAAARARHPEQPDATFRCLALEALPPGETHDFVVASGIFNVQAGIGAAEWAAHVEATLDAMWRRARRGIAFNMLSGHADQPRPGLHHAAPGALVDRLAARLSHRFVLDQGYGLFDFTLSLFR
ncbi:methyltransferase domain-containing protein [Roseomonas sp. GC11]|uniref:class I SAM-dependent methyltransferase n=1 Tax=Roseomonas sp. GC11 TaxID=2950546 RepID=UPI00210A36A6|nr:class I SAM-dependent methyltransferase [Roseomonas sp. GC11]MCQ4161688.1 methyltransferase domain-containing protein [Roseomonas sp. GC11]